MADQVLKLHAVKDRVKLGRVSIYQGMKKGTFPRSIKLTGRAVGWRESDIEQWIAERAKGRAEA